MAGNSNYELYREIHGASAPKVPLLLLDGVILLAASGTTSRVTVRNIKIKYKTNDLWVESSNAERK